MRITGGSARGRVLKVPDTGTVRPTSDRMRQQLFNMLEHSAFAVQADFRVAGAHVMDGFCGSGALGLEALSRGAASAVFVDIDRRVLQIAKDNTQMCGFDDAAEFILKGVPVLGACPAHVPARALVLLDPPYRKGLVTPALLALHAGGWLADGALVVAETERRWADAVDAHFTRVDMREGGDSQLNIWQYAAS